LNNCPARKRKKGVKRTVDDCTIPVSSDSWNSHVLERRSSEDLCQVRHSRNSSGGKSRHSRKSRDSRYCGKRPISELDVAD